MEAKAELCCNVQQTADVGLTEHGTLEELTNYAKKQLAAILEQDRKSTPRYWRLGTALNLIRRKLKRGEWLALLKQLRIERTLAWRAQMIASTFKDEREVAGLTLKEALSRRQRGRTTEGAKEARGSLGRFLESVCRRADSLFDEAGCVERHDARNLLQTAVDAMAKIELLCELLKTQAGAQDTSPSGSHTTAPPEDPRQAETVDPLPTPA